MKRIVQVICVSGLVVLLLALGYRVLFGTEKFEMGARLPEGKVKPRLVSAFGQAFLLAPDGSLWGWGGKGTNLSAVLRGAKVTPVPTRIGNDCDWRDITAGSSFAVGLKADGSLWGWGLDYSGQLTQLNSTGKPLEPVRISADTNWVQIKAGAGHCLALKSDGSLWAWGQNDCGQVGDGTSNSVRIATRIGQETDWKQISAGAFNSFGLKRDGTIWGWGLDLTFSGKAPTNTLSPKEIDWGTNWVSISAGGFHLAGIKSDGTLWLCGQNAFLAASAFATLPSATMIQIGPDHDWNEVHSAEDCFFARKKDGTWWVCGSEHFGRLGLGTSGANVDSPKRLPFDFEPWAFSPADKSTLLLTHDGKLWSWGVRLGAPPPPPAVQKTKKFVNDIYGHLRKNSRLFRIEDEVTDDGPGLVWVLPEEVVRAK